MLLSEMHTSVDSGFVSEFDLTCTADPSKRWRCCGGRCDVTVEQRADLLFVVFFSRLAEWKFALSRSFPCKTLSNPQPPPSLPHTHTHSQAICLTVSHTHSLRLSRIEQVAREVLWPFPKWRFGPPPLPDYHVSIHPPTASLLKIIM